MGPSTTAKSYRFVSFVCACVRAVWLTSGIRSQILAPTVPLFHYAPPIFPFFLRVRAGLSLFVCIEVNSKRNRCGTREITGKCSELKLDQN